MTRFFSAMLLLGLSAFAGACSITPPRSTPPGRVCNFQQYRINTPIPSAEDLPGSDASKPDSELTERVRQALTSPNSPGPTVPGSMLFLSGGSLNGAFGAGFMDGWARANGGRLPDFDVVTGISTGAILATWAFINDTRPPVENYSIISEGELLRPFIRRGAGEPGPLAYLRVARRGAVADLRPMRDRLHSRVTPEVLRAVAARSSEAGGNRLLVVGVVDVDSGQAYAFDLGAMAERYVAAGAAAPSTEETAEQRVARDCYVDAIFASSSVPLAALPVFIDNRMYVDGGARFGMFSEDLLSGIPSSKKRATSTTRLYVIANGDLETEPRCGPGSRADRRTGTERPCTVGEADDPASVRHRDWDLLDLARRSEDILVNQVYRFSASSIIARRDENPVFFARMGRDALGFRATIANPALGAGTETCERWRAIDDQRLRPLQFYPRYMHCLIAYGASRGSAGRWDLQPSPPASPGAPPPAAPVKPDS